MNVEEPREAQAPLGDRILGPNGLLAETLPGYEARPPQMEMANLCETVIADGSHALIEAATGTGKSLAYLIPAIFAGKRVVVSTDTIALQEQLVMKDLPFLKRVLDPQLPVPLTYAIAKGKSHFLCPRNSQQIIDERTLFPENASASVDAEACLRELRMGAWDGDRAHLELAVSDQAWGTLSAEESCTGTECEYAAECPYLRSKAAYQEAQIVVTNHTMYLLHHYVRSRSGGIVGILPDHAVWIGDEAHTLSDKACDQFGIEITDRSIPAYIRRVKRQAHRIGLKLTDGDYNEAGIRRASVLLFEAFHGCAKLEQLLSEFPEEILTLARELAETLIGHLKKLRTAIYWAQMDIPSSEKQKRAAAGRLYERADELCEQLREVLELAPTVRSVWAECEKCFGAGWTKTEERTVLDGLAAAERVSEYEATCWACDGRGGRAVELERDESEYVRYAEVTLPDRQNQRNVSLHCKPIETRPIFEHKILTSLQSAVFTSATLASGPGTKGFAPVASELGLKLAETPTLQVESPFDYMAQMACYIPAYMPEFRSPEYHLTLTLEIKAILEKSHGRAFVLFTSNRDLREVKKLIERQIPFPLLCQGEGSKDFLLEEFKRTPNAVLFGVRTFWTGVDIPGEQLSCVVITKLPFPVPDHPLTKARCNRIEARGGSGFRDFSLPRAIRDLKQGAGRLIRSKSDTGLLCILDPRLRNSRYGVQIADSLPSCACVKDLAQVQLFDDPFSE